MKSSTPSLTKTPIKYKMKENIIDVLPQLPFIHRTCVIQTHTYAPHEDGLEWRCRDTLWFKHKAQGLWLEDSPQKEHREEQLALNDEAGETLQSNHLWHLNARGGDRVAPRIFWNCQGPSYILIHSVGWWKDAMSIIADGNITFDH